MKTILLLVGKTTDKHFLAGISDYAERIGHYMPFDIVTIPELKNTKSISEDQQKTMEGEQILKQLQPSDTLVLLDEHGKELRSIELAKWLEQKKQTAKRPRQRTTVTIEVDLLPPDGQAGLYRADLSRVYYY